MYQMYLDHHNRQALPWIVLSQVLAFHHYRISFYVNSIVWVIVLISNRWICPNVLRVLRCKFWLIGCVLRWIRFLIISILCWILLCICNRHKHIVVIGWKFPYDCRWTYRAGWRSTWTGTVWRTDTGRRWNWWTKRTRGRKRGGWWKTRTCRCRWGKRSGWRNRWTNRAWGGKRSGWRQRCTCTTWRTHRSAWR